ncbi:MAG: AAA family ATPase [Alphaproteobacteria bacterium]|nr:AAA family ATPase [Alphaproteobacteria bacterium]
MYLKLVLPSEKYLPSVYEAIDEYRKHPSKFEINAVQKMIEAQENNFADYFKQTENERLGINLKSGYVSHTVFWLIDNNKYIGTFNLRHSLTPYLKQIGGHIAYQIRPSEQKKGYAYAGLLLCLNEAYKMGLNKVLLTCKMDNIPSYATMNKAMINYGGIEDTSFNDNDGIINKRLWLWTTKKPTLYMICGFLGAGKTTFSQKLSAQTNAAHLNPDEWCMKLYPQKEYETNWDNCFINTVNLLWEKTAEYAKQNKSVIFDMGFWNKKNRQNDCKKALKLGFEPVIYYLYAPDEILIKRISQRRGVIAEHNIKNFSNIKQYFEAPEDDEFYVKINNF